MCSTSYSSTSSSLSRMRSAGLLRLVASQSVVTRAWGCAYPFFAISGCRSAVVPDVVMVSPFGNVLPEANAPDRSPVHAAAGSSDPGAVRDGVIDGEEDDLV